MLSYTASVEELDSLSTRPREHSDGEEEDKGDEAAPGKAEPRKTSAEIEASIMKARKVQRADRKAAAKATAKTKAMKAKKEPVERKVWTKRDKPKFDKNNKDPIDYEGGRIYCSFAKGVFAPFARVANTARSPSNHGSRMSLPNPLLNRLCNPSIRTSLAKRLRNDR